VEIDTSNPDSVQEDPDMSIDPELPPRPSFEKTRRFKLATETNRADRRQQNTLRDERLRSVEPDADFEMSEADPLLPNYTKRKGARY
jgi:hypothetical protein